MLYFNLQVLLCTEIAVPEHFAPPQLWLLEGPQGAKKISTLTIARHILRPLINYDRV